MPNGIKKIHLSEVDSTNNICKKELEHSDLPLLVIAKKQTNGRGRNNNSWASPEGNIHMSFGFKSIHLSEGLSVKAGYITAELIYKIYKKRVLLKWPNDLIFLDKKIGGVLVETSSIKNQFYTIIGIGINLKIIPEESHWGDLGEDSTSQREIANFAEQLAKKLNVMVTDGINENWNEKWMELCVHLNQNIALAESNEQVLCLGIDSSGKLIYKDSDGQIRLSIESSINVPGLY